MTWIEMLAARPPVDRHATSGELERLGATRAETAAALRDGALTRLRRGRFGLRGLDDRVARAIRLGGSATCASALALRGCETLHDARLHLRIRGASPVSAAGIVAHRTPPRAAHRPGPVDGPLLALACALRCLDRDAFVVVADAALRRLLVTPDELDGLHEHSSRRDARKLAAVDGRSQSVTESLLRVRLRALGIRVRLQVRIEGVGYVDALVGDRLVIECDSVSHHTSVAAYHEDRRRDAVAIELGYTVLRLTYQSVMGDWPEVERRIRALVAARRHDGAPRRAS